MDERIVFEKKTKGSTRFKPQKIFSGNVATRYVLPGYGHIDSLYPLHYTNEVKSDIQLLYKPHWRDIGDYQKGYSGSGYRSYFFDGFIGDELYCRVDYPIIDTTGESGFMSLSDIVSFKEIGGCEYVDYYVAETIFHMEIIAFLKCVYLLSKQFFYEVSVFEYKYASGEIDNEKHRGICVSFNEENKCAAFIELFKCELNRVVNFNMARGYKNQVWASLVRERDKGCVNCGSLQDLHAHHIKSYAKNPKLRYDTKNGVTLCKSCHNLVHSGQIMVGA